MVIEFLSREEWEKRISAIMPAYLPVVSPSAKAVAAIVDSIMAIQKEAQAAHKKRTSPLSGLQIKTYTLKRANRSESGAYWDEITLSSYEQMEGSYKWAIKMGLHVLNKFGQWEYEPIPSSRDEAYFERCRYSTPEEALFVFRRIMDGIT